MPPPWPDLAAFINAQKGTVGERFLDGTLFVGAATLMARVVLLLWNLVSQPVRHVLSSKNTKCAVGFGPIHPLPVGCSLRCLFVRYGTDAYIERLASQQEKYEGRLRNRVLPVELTPKGEVNYAHFAIRVHKRLGTQFKLFINCPDETRAADTAKHLRDLAFCIRNVDVVNVGGAWRVWFLLTNYGSVLTVEGFENNLFPAF